MSLNLQSLSVFASPKIRHFLCFFPVVKFVTLLLCLFVVLVSIVDKFYILTKKGKMFLNICGIYEYLFLNSWINDYFVQILTLFSINELLSLLSQEFPTASAILHLSK